MSEREVEGILKGCSLFTMLLVIEQILNLEGYARIKYQGRRRWHEKSLNGGHELACELHGGVAPQVLLVKVVDAAMNRRMLDELAGVVERMGADRGLLISNRICPDRALARARDYGAIKLFAWDARKLTERMTLYRVGVRQKGDPDYAYFGDLEARGEEILSFIEYLEHEQS